jgi:hypothetical protein
VTECPTFCRVALSPSWHAEVNDTATEYSSGSPAQGSVDRDRRNNGRIIGERDIQEGNERNFVLESQDHCFITTHLAPPVKSGELRTP